MLELLIAASDHILPSNWLHSRFAGPSQEDHGLRVAWTGDGRPPHGRRPQSRTKQQMATEIFHWKYLHFWPPTKVLRSVDRGSLEEGLVLW